jgi:L-alanine-DL-glutamate epimerase-like enolase superfamily enzyme
MPAVTELQLYAVDLPFRTTFRHAAAARHSSGSLFLRVRLDNGVEGWGECLPRPYVSGESREGTFALLRDAILPALLGHEFQALSDVAAFLEKCDGKAPPDWVESRVPQSSAWCSVDLALIDAFGRASAEQAWVGAAGKEAPAPHGLDRHRYSGVASADRGWRFAVSLLKMRAYRFPHVKLKTEGDGAIGAATMARRLLGRGVDLRIDANMAWGVKQALDIIHELGGIGIECFEQPIAADDLDGLAQLVRQSSSTIVVDEGLTDRESLQTLIRRRACTGVNVRISKCGGLIGAHARCREALDAGLMLQIGCQVGESSLLSSAHVTLLSALASSSPGVRYAEGCFGRHLLREDPFSPSIQFRYGGRPPHPPGAPGLGVRVDQGMLERWTVERTYVS